MSLNRLKIKALNAALKVLIFVIQKLIKKYEVIPISSHPMSNITKLLANNKNIILYKNDNNKNKNFSRKTSPRI